MLLFAVHCMNITAFENVAIYPEGAEFAPALEAVAEPDTSPHATTPKASSKSVIAHIFVMLFNFIFCIFKSLLYFLRYIFIYVLMLMKMWAIAIMT